jgi:hypothetical protein
MTGSSSENAVVRTIWERRFVNESDDPEAAPTGDAIMIDRCRGALIGLAVGDALGAAVEFKSPGSFKLVTGYRNGGPHGLNATG